MMKGAIFHFANWVFSDLLESVVLKIFLGPAPRLPVSIDYFPISLLQSPQGVPLAMSRWMWQHSLILIDLCYLDLNETPA